MLQMIHFIERFKNHKSIIYKRLLIDTIMVITFIYIRQYQFNRVLI